MGLGEDCEEALADVGCTNAVLYVVNQESIDLLCEVHTGRGCIICAS